MPSLLEALAGSLGGTDQYLQDDPFYMGGVGLSKTQLSAPRNNMEAFLGPAILGALSGTLTGIGKRNALDAGYADYKASPLFKQLIGEDSSALGLSDYSADTRPEGWTPDIGKKEGVLAALLGEQQKDEAAKKAERDWDIKKYFMDKQALYDPETGTLAPFTELTDIEAQAEAYKEKLKKDAQAGSGVPGLENIPLEFQPDAVKELKTKEMTAKADDLINQQFDVAKTVKSVPALFSGTTASNELEGVAQSLRTYVQHYLGREMNGPEQERFLALLPDWNDTEAQIEKKQSRFKDLMTSLAGSTPILDAFSGSGAGGSESPPSPPAGFVLTGKRDANGNWGMRRAK